MIKKVLALSVIALVVMSCSSSQNASSSNSGGTSTTTTSTEKKESTDSKVIQPTGKIPDVNKKVNKLQIQHAVE
ncbi:MAG: hypothetical protein KF732_02400 [Flavobacteriales bacterium]|nr:hypothetical protein [Flavobacteriales bacterium]MBV6483654.1 hypothetical protein [Flavobacteriales bacterium]MBX2958784.1 hypothetical protein [Flavobacteriales bacterium]HRN40529.1 hypothetical protein [Vicingus sp.]HRP60177.1 hypothetical protein [Vicingus sp.]